MCIVCIRCDGERWRQREGDKEGGLNWAHSVAEKANLYVNT